MKKITQVLNSPMRIGMFALAIVALCGVIAFTTMGANAKAAQGKTIGMDKGVAIALEDAGFKENQVSGLTAHYDNEDGIAAYDIQFLVGETEYDYTIKAADGTIIEANREKADQEDKAEVKIIDEEKKVNTEKNDDSTQTVKPADSNSNNTGTSSSKPSTSNSNNGSASSQNTAPKYIGLDKAKAIALSNAGVSASSTTFTKAKKDRDDGKVVYEIEFYSGGYEYEYEINAVSGKITEKDVERDDDYDHDYDDDDDDDDEYDD